MILGVAICAAAGAAKEKDLRGSRRRSRGDRAQRRSPRSDVLHRLRGAVGDGQFRFRLRRADQAGGAEGLGRPAAAPNAIWALVFTGNYLVNAVYSLT